MANDKFKKINELPVVDKLEDGDYVVSVKNDKSVLVKNNNVVSQKTSDGIFKRAVTTDEPAWYIFSKKNKQLINVDLPRIHFEIVYTEAYSINAPLESEVIRVSGGSIAYASRISTGSSTHITKVGYDSDFWYIYYEPKKRFNNHSGVGYTSDIFNVCGDLIYTRTDKVPEEIILVK